MWSLACIWSVTWSGCKTTTESGQMGGLGSLSSSFFIIDTSCVMPGRKAPTNTMKREIKVFDFIL
eukprot:scaffold16111_cov172-Amphora_coffeaeformis.AAC.10